MADVFTVSRPSAERVGLLLLIIFAFAWRVHALVSQSLWRDEVDAIYFALRDLPATLSMFVQPGQNGPLYFLALRPWFHWVGANDFALRLPSALAGVLAIPLLWQVARLLVDSPSTVRNSLPLPLLAAAFLTLNPYHLWYSQEGKMYALITCLTLLATWFWLKGIALGGWRPWLGYLVTVSVAIYCHLLMILVIPLHMLWFFIAWPQSRHHWRGYGAALAGLTLPYLPMVWWQWDLLVATSKRTGFNFTPLAQMLRTLLLNHSRGFLPWDDLRWLAPIFFLGLAGLVLGASELAVVIGDGQRIPTESQGRRHSWQLAGAAKLAAWRRLLLVATWLLGPIFFIYALSLRQPIFTDRYIIWISPAAMLLLVFGVAAVARNTGLLGKPLAALFILYVAGFWLYTGWEQKTRPMKYNLRDAIQYIAARRDPDTLLILQIPHMEWSYRYYSSDFQPDLFQDSDARLGRWAGGLWTNGGTPDDQARSEVDVQMLQITSGAAELWVLRSEVEMWDARHLMDEWLDQHGEVAEQADFLGAQVKRYIMVNG